jgi:magnesium chelatase family protein
LEFPHRRLTVNLAPAELRKQGSGLDLPIAVAVALAVMRKKPPPRSAFLGELALDGQ